MEQSRKGSTKKTAEFVQKCQKRRFTWVIKSPLMFECDFETGRASEGAFLHEKVTLGEGEDIRMDESLLS